MKYYIIAGEASGDLHGSKLISALKEVDQDANFQVWGGDLMEAAGATLNKHYRDLAFMGFLEVVKNLKTILRNFDICKKAILEYQPDVLILIDYPGFNLRMAKWAKKKGIKVFYYISPQIWAWHSSRVHQIKEVVDRMFVILPFEKAFYEKYQVQVDFVGHPLLDSLIDIELDPDFRQKHQLSQKEIIALLPGSRRQEISKMLEKMLTMVSQFSNYQFIIAGAPSIPKSYYQSLLQQASLENLQVKIVEGVTYQLLRQAKAALVTSGTATLETALLDVPQVVCYTGNSLSYRIAKRLINVDYISLVNLILNRPLVTELIQADFNKEKLTTSLQHILQEENAQKIKEGYIALKEKLGNQGASNRTAELMWGYLQEA